MQYTCHGPKEAEPTEQKCSLSSWRMCWKVGTCLYTSLQLQNLYVWNIDLPLAEKNTEVRIPRHECYTAPHMEHRFQFFMIYSWNQSHARPYLSKTQNTFDACDLKRSRMIMAQWGSWSNDFTWKNTTCLSKFKSKSREKEHNFIMIIKTLVVWIEQTSINLQKVPFGDKATSFCESFFASFSKLFWIGKEKGHSCVVDLPDHLNMIAIWVQGTTASFGNSKGKTSVSMGSSRHPWIFLAVVESAICKGWGENHVPQGIKKQTPRRKINTLPPLYVYIFNVFLDCFGWHGVSTHTESHKHVHFSQGWTHCGNKKHRCDEDRIKAWNHSSGT